MNNDFITSVAMAADQIPGPLTVPWPMRGMPNAFQTFSAFPDWRDFVLALRLRDTLPQIITAKYQRALKPHLMVWIDFDLIKVGEMAALATLELALKDRYGHRVKKNKQGELRFADLLRFMVDGDGLTEDKFPMSRRYGGTVVPVLTGKQRPSLADIRNSAAHGDPFDGYPWAGLLEMVRDLIEYAYRDFRP
jgi:hypothetical protein